MRKIKNLMEEIRALAQESEAFHEVELSLLIRTHDGEKSQFVRLQTEKNSTGEVNNDDIFQCNGPQWF